ncbi:hypothetical protein FS837_010578, partial [Tulasnella sp. UAMH 9824]
MSKPAVEQGSLPKDVVSLDKEAIPISHPLDALTPDEISLVSLAVRQHVASERKDIKAVKFINSSIIAPLKRDVLAFLGIPVEPGVKSEPVNGPLARRAETDFLDPVTGNNYNATLTLSTDKKAWVVDEIETLPEGTQPQITVEELIECDELVRKDETVLKLAAEVGVSPEQLCADGWSIGWDDRWPTAKRIQQCLLYARYAPHSNLYAHPLDFIPVVDVNAKKVIHIDFPPHRLDGDKLSAKSTAPPSPDEDALKASGRTRLPPPLQKAEYLPDLVDEATKAKPAPDPLKPLHVVQPEGVSFKVTGGSVLEWQNWRMHVAFSGREGIAISTVTWNDGGVVRPIFYRLSLAEMVVPYAAPEHPHPRKFAFDVGEYGMGTQANELSLGCDCLGTIHYLAGPFKYLPGAFVGHDGKPIVLKQAICIHEEDNGLLWKHTDYRVGGRAHAVRSRRLVISMVCTVANYEYAFAYHFYLDGTVELEIGLTGIVNTYLLAQGEDPAPYGTQVAPRINAQYHQHVFSLRVDPMIDGLQNTVVESDVEAVSDPTGSAENHAGNAFVSKDVRVARSSEGIRDYNAAVDRRWKIVNPTKKHFASGKEVGYGIMAKGAWETLKCAENAWARKRAAFAEHSVWVVKDVEGRNGSERLWPAGKYVPQTRDNPKDSVLSWTGGPEESLEGQDVVVFLTVGLNHIPRPEDWPVMPMEHLK